MITITIVAFVVAIVLPRLNNNDTQVRAVIRKFSVLGRELRFRAKLQDATFRLVIDMETNEKGEPVDSYWVESAPGSVMNDYNPKSPPKNPAQLAAAQKEAKEQDEKIPPPRFTIDRSITRKPIDLPRGLVFESVELSSVHDPITKGVVYIDFLPSGFADEAAIHLKLGKHNRWTLVVLPLTGRMIILPEKRSLRSMRHEI